MIPFGRLERTPWANDRSVHDGIVFTERGDFLISVFTRTTRGSRTAKSLISGVSALAYKVYGPEPAKTRT
jgi:hypothetical protein